MTLPIPDNLPAVRQQHLAFIFKGSKLLTIGVNSKKTHPLAKHYKQYRFTEVQCAELNALIRLGALHKGKEIDFKRLTMVVVRIGKDGSFKYSKPCDGCVSMLKKFNFKKVYYSNDGDFETI